jgi:hypothetical protein
MRTLALIIILVGAVLVVVTRFPQEYARRARCVRGPRRGADPRPAVPVTWPALPPADASDPHASGRLTRRLHDR